MRSEVDKVPLAEQKWKVIISGGFLLFSALVVVSFFSSTFDFGDEVIRYFLSVTTGANWWRPYATWAVGCFIFIFLYLLDFSYWTSRCGTLMRKVLSFAILICFGGAGLLAMSDYPYLPLSFAMMLIPFSALFLVGCLFRNNRTEDTALVIGFNFVCSSIIILSIWLCWLFGAFDVDGNHNHWEDNRQKFTQQAQCANVDWGLSAGVLQHSDGQTTLCLAAFLLWASPLFLAGVLLLLGLFLMLLSQTDIMQQGGSGHVDGKKAHDMKKIGRILTGFVALSAFGMYSTATIAGAGMQVAKMVMCIYAIIIVAIVVVVVSLIGSSSLKDKIRNNPMVKSIETLGSPGVDILHAFFILASPIFFFLVVLSFANQVVRKLRWACGIKFASEKAATAEGAGDREETRETTRAHKHFGSSWPVTRLTQSWLRHLDTWSWTKAFKYVRLMIYLMWAMNYGSNLTFVFCSWLISVLSKFHPGVTTGLFSVIGIVMFLIPVVPGPAVYLTSGVLVTPVWEQFWGGRQSGGGGSCGNATASDNSTAVADAAAEPEAAINPLAFWFACGVANVISYVLKHVAHVMQQKMIGEAAGNAVSVRAAVGVNSRLMKTIRILLMKPGLSIAKVSIMCGGPDWPTSVAAGILRVPVFGLLLGLTPMFLMTVPTTTVGAFFNPPSKALENYKTFLFALVILVQLVFGAFMFHCAGKVSDEEIAAIPDDEEVAELDRKSRNYNMAYERATEFFPNERLKIKGLPLVPKLLLSSSTFMLLCTFYLLNLVPEMLFQPFGLADCLSSYGAAPYNFVIPGVRMLGMVAIGMLVLSIILMQFFGMWAKRAANEELERMRRDGELEANDLDTKVPVSSSNARAADAPEPALAAPPPAARLPAPQPSPSSSSRQRDTTSPSTPSPAPSPAPQLRPASASPSRAPPPTTMFL